MIEHGRRHGRRFRKIIIEGTKQSYIFLKLFGYILLILACNQIKNWLPHRERSDLERLTLCGSKSKVTPMSSSPDSCISAKYCCCIRKASSKSARSWASLEPVINLFNITLQMKWSSDHYGWFCFEMTFAQFYTCQKRISHIISIDSLNASFYMYSPPNMNEGECQKKEIQVQSQSQNNLIAKQTIHEPNTFGSSPLPITTRLKPPVDTPDLCPPIEIKCAGCDRRWSRWNRSQKLSMPLVNRR